jgi:hypothetical protein
MPRGDKSTYTDKQKRQAEHIEEGYEKRGVSEDEAARLGYREQNDWWRQEKWIGPGQEDQHGSCEERWPQGWCGLGGAVVRRALCLCEEGGSDP